MNSLKFVTWNIRGIGSQAKRLKVLNHINKLQADICLLQETHTSESDCHKLRTPQFNQIFSAHFNSRQRGVAILIHKNISFINNNTITDPEGRFIIINITIHNTPTTIACIYGPNKDDSSFFHTFFTSLSNLSDSPIIIGGDFNTVLNPSLDRSNNSNSTRNCQSIETIKQFMSDFGLGDGWRLKHPTDREYSFFSPVHHSYSRIDFFLTSNSIISKISDVLIHPIAISDHAPVSLTWNTNHSRKPSNRWRLNTSLIDDPRKKKTTNRKRT